MGSMAHAPPGGEGDVCHICLESSPPPMQSGCACRGAAGLAHVGCRVRAARALQKDKGWQVWWECQTCLQDFTGGMSAGLANAVWSEVRDHAEEEDERLVAASILAASLDAQGKHAEAEQMGREVSAVQTRVLGAEHHDTRKTADILARFLSEQGGHAEGLAGAATKARGGAEMGKGGNGAAVGEAAESEEHAVRKRVREGTQGSRTFADAGSKRKKQ